MKREFLIVITPKGEFCKVKPQKSLKEGDLVEFSSEQIVSHSLSRQPRGKIGKVRPFLLMAASLLLLLLTIPVWNAFYPPVYASVSIDINPSVELEVDRNYNVVDAKGRNQDGEALLEEIHWKKRPLLSVTENILQQAGNKGYFVKNRDVLIVPVGLKEKAAADQIGHLFQRDRSLLDHTPQKDVKITFVIGDNETKQKADQEKMSIGKYILYESVKKMNQNITVETARTLSVSELSAELGGISKLPRAIEYVKPGGQENSKPDKQVSIHMPGSSVVSSHINKGSNSPVNKTGSPEKGKKNINAKLMKERRPSPVKKVEKNSLQQAESHPSPANKHAQQGAKENEKRNQKHRRYDKSDEEHGGNNGAGDNAQHHDVNKHKKHDREE